MNNQPYYDTILEAYVTPAAKPAPVVEVYVGTVHGVYPPTKTPVKVFACGDNYVKVCSNTGKVMDSHFQQFGSKLYELCNKAANAFIDANWI